MRGKTGVVLTLLLAAILSLSGSSEAASKKSKRRAKAKPVPVDFDVHLPVLGTRLWQFPPGEGKSVADQACLNCHSADLVAQQRLTEKQWAASVTKMAGWGAEVPETKKDALVAYLVKNFGPDNDRFQPIITRPVGR